MYNKIDFKSNNLMFKASPAKIIENKTEQDKVTSMVTDAIKTINENPVPAAVALAALTASAARAAAIINNNEVAKTNSPLTDTNPQSTNTQTSFLNEPLPVVRNEDIKSIKDIKETRNSKSYQFEMQDGTYIDMEVLKKSYTKYYKETIYRYNGDEKQIILEKTWKHGGSSPRMTGYTEFNNNGDLLAQEQRINGYQWLDAKVYTDLSIKKVNEDGEIKISIQNNKGNSLTLKDMSNDVDLRDLSDYSEDIKCYGMERSTAILGYKTKEGKFKIIAIDPNCKILFENDSANELDDWHNCAYRYPLVLTNQETGQEIAIGEYFYLEKNNDKPGDFFIVKDSEGNIVIELNESENCKVSIEDLKYNRASISKDGKRTEIEFFDNMKPQLVLNRTDDGVQYTRYNSSGKEIFSIVANEIKLGHSCPRNGRVPSDTLILKNGEEVRLDLDIKTGEIIGSSSPSIKQTVYVL